MIIANIKFNKTLRVCASSFSLPPLSISLLLYIEGCGEALNCPYVEKSELLASHSHYSRSSIEHSLHELRQLDIISQRGGKASPSASPNRHCWNKTQYALTGEGRMVIRYFNKKYAELMNLPIPVSYKGGFPKGAKRAGRNGKMILPEGFIRSDKALKHDIQRGLS